MLKKPNVLYIMADEFNAGCLSIEGREVKTPNLDSIARDGVRFSHAYCNNPVCAPSRISFITGQYPHTHQILGNRSYVLEDRNENTLGAVLRRAGYQTAIIGKSHMVAEWDREGFEHIRYCDLCDCDANEPLHNHYFKYIYENGLAEVYDYAGGKKATKVKPNSRAFTSRIPACHSIEAWTGNEAMEFLTARDTERPFFLHLSFQRPHEPLSIPYDRELLYDPEKLTLPESAKDYFENRFASKPEVIRRNADRLHGFPYIPEDESDLKLHLAFYYSIITLIDEQIGRVTDLLKQQGEYDNTIIIFTADHGDFAGEHGIMLKNMGIYESIHRIPFLFKYPGGPANMVKDQIIESVDMYPSICELCGVRVPEGVEGQSFLPLIESGAKGREHTICEWQFNHYKNKVNAIRTRDFRLVYYGHEDGGELYDLQKDPGEIQNLFNNTEYAEVQRELFELMFDHINKYRVKLDFQMDIKIEQGMRNCLTRMLHKGHVQWGQIEQLLK